jgi:hypothetical protein
LVWFHLSLGSAAVHAWVPAASCLNLCVFVRINLAACLPLLFGLYPTDRDGVYSFDYLNYSFCWPAQISLYASSTYRLQLVYFLFFLYSWNNCHLTLAIE